MVVRDAYERRVLFSQAVAVANAAEGAVREERDAKLATVLQFALAGPERRGELVLHAGQIALAEDGAGQVDLSDVRVRNPNHEHLSGVQELLQDPNWLLVADPRVGPVVLVQADGLYAQVAQRRFGGTAEVSGVSVYRPAAIAGTDMATLGGDQDRAPVAAPRRQRFGYEYFAMARLGTAQAVGVGRVDQGHPGIQSGMNGLNGACFVRAPFNGHRHLAEADRPDLP